MHASAESVRRDIAAIARPPLRRPVSEVAEDYVYCRSSGGTPIRWSQHITPYMVEPMDMLTSREHDSVIFVGPARTGKTQALIDGGAGYVITCDHSDMAVVQISQVKASDFSKLRINYMLRHSPELGKYLSTNKQDDNVYEKFFKAGNVLKIIWPTVKQLSSSEYKFIFLTDFDRMPEDLDKEGSSFILAQKRTQTYLSRGMTVAESSPGYEVLDPNWVPHSPHEAPPTRGILSLYNQGDRRRWYMKCPHCSEYFMPEPGIEAFSFKVNKDEFGYTDTELKSTVGLICSASGCIIEEKHKYEMNLTGMWVPEGCRIEQKGKKYIIVGTKRNVKCASFWMSGAAAAYQSWENIVQRHINALRDYDITGAEEGLKTTTNVDQGTAYLPLRLKSKMSSDDLEKRAEDLPKRMVPKGGRFLIAAVDVQGSKFVVQVIAYGVGLENWLIDRFDIHISKRMSGGEPLPLDPAGYVEDWNLIIDKVIKRNYPLDDGSGRSMSILQVGCDSGGKAGVTDRAYDFWRSLKKKGLHKRFRLVKGERPAPNSHKPTVSESYPDNTKRKDRKASARGDVPVWLLNTTLLKDSVSSDMKRLEAGPRYMHYPDWLRLWFYEELTAEVRDDKGWNNPTGARNETFDLYTYAKGVVQSLIIDAKMPSIDWDKPPLWAAEWDKNNQIDIVIKESESKTSPFRKRGVISKGVR